MHKSAIKLRIDLLRHGETTLSHTLRGSTDDDLTEKGWLQMQQTINQAVHVYTHQTNQKIDHQSRNVGQFQNMVSNPLVQWDVIFSSPLKRCRLFAENFVEKVAAQFEVQSQLPLFLDQNLKEMHFGDWEGISTQTICENEPELLANFWQEPTKYTPPNAETMQIFHDRVLKAIHNIQQQMLENKWQHALIVTHGGVIKLLKCLAMNQPLDDILKMSAELGQLNSFELDEDSSIRLVGKGCWGKLNSGENKA